jgi:hypothetical protein
MLGRLLGCQGVLVGDRADHAQGGMPAGSVVVLDPRRDPGPGQPNPGSSSRGTSSSSAKATASSTPPTPSPETSCGPSTAPASRTAAEPTLPPSPTRPAEPNSSLTPSAVRPRPHDRRIPQSATPSSPSPFPRPQRPNNRRQRWKRSSGSRWWDRSRLARGRRPGRPAGSRVRRWRSLRPCRPG